METLKRQYIIFETIEKMKTNFGKDSASRKTANYIQTRISTLEVLYEEFNINHETLNESADEKILTEDYSKLFGETKALYDAFRNQLQSCKPSTTVTKGVPSAADELVTQQTTNFRAFTRMVRNLNIDNISEKWEIEDKLQMLQTRWKAIDETHWKLDNIYIGADVDYEQEFTQHEVIYESTKKELNRKLNATIHQSQAAPKIEIPTFFGNYNQWPTFMDLFSEEIHNNKMISKAQKMQHLKGKLRGEAERIVQHLTVSADNYDTCWKLLNHRYNNTQLLFTKQMQTFMNQPAVQQQTAYEIKRLHDTSLEAVHAMHNLGIDTSTWDPFLVHVLANKLDSDTYTSYMETRKKPRELPQFDEFIDFLEGKFTALEPIIKRKQTTPQHKTAPTQARDFPSTSRTDGHNNGKFTRHIAKSFHANTDRNCPICKTGHILLYCKTFQNMMPNMKRRTVSQLNICENCLFSHNGKQCNSIKRCKVCNNAHHTSLHDLLCDASRADMKAMPPSMPTTSAVPKEQDTLDKQRKSNHVAGNFNEVLLATVQIKVMTADGTYTKLRCLLDQGSQINLITETAAQKLGLRRQKQNATVSGIGLSAKQSKGTLQLTCESIYGDHVFTTNALIMTNMINNLPNYSFEKQQWPHLNNINLADPDYNISRPIDILLDAGVYADIIMNGILRGPEHAPIAQQTKLGWVLLGNVKPFNCHAVLNNLEDITRFWEIEEITEPSINLTPMEQYCETLYETTTRRLKNGRYEVKLPMQPNFEQNLGASKPQAIAQLLQLEKRLAKNEELSQSYKNFMHEYIKLGHMKPCNIHREPSCFLPHHGVIKPDSTTTKLRTVFNASSPTRSGYSLNQLMESGPNLQQDLQAMLLRWRSYRYVYTADIEKFYRQILIAEEDQHLQKIVWRDSPAEPIQEFQLCTVTYGTKAAAFLAMRTIKQLAADDGPQYPLAATILNKQLYVDDLLGGDNDLKEAITSQQQLINLLQVGGFNLRKWASNHKGLLDNLTEDQISQTMLDFKNIQNNKTLGVLWNPCTDQFTFNIADMNVQQSDVITKRSLLSDLSKQYDPGWLSPVTMKGKIIFQQVWKLSLSWDEPLPAQVQEEWKIFRNELKMLNNITISRWMGNAQQHIELHGFCDSSEKGFGCVIYCKSTNENGQTTVKQIAAKTKLAPINKHITLPKLELCGAALLAKLMQKTIDVLNKQTVQAYGWTDSTVVLGWLQGDITRWKTFVANRVSQITKVMPSNCWRHVRSEENPADCASRGLLPSQLITHPMWFEGPQWLKEELKTLKVTPTYEEPTEERRTNKQTCSLQLTSPVIETLLNNNSSMARVVRALGWVSRFVNNARGKNILRSPHLTTAELRNAHTTIIRSVQNKHFAEEITQLQKHKTMSHKSRLLNLNPILDKENVLRVGGRLKYANINFTQKHPIILPHNDKLTEMQIVQDQWKLVIYYNMTTYWQGLSSVKYYVNHLTNLCTQETSFSTIAAQLQHDLRELEHYNDLLSTEHGSLGKRTRRGLINGVGYIANSLFGVLDERFAQQYDKDIQLVRINENHLLQLLKNHTSIIEGEYNLLQRHEQVMNQQFTAINKHLAEQDSRIKADRQNNMYITATALAANMVMGNLRRLQQRLLDLLTDVKDGRVDVHLLKPEQFEEQLNIISGQLPGELSLPCVNTRHCTRDMYKLSRTHVHLTKNFLIFEFKLPLVNTEQYELNRIIPIPQIVSHTTQQVAVTSEYLAVNLKKDAMIPLSHQDISSCLQVEEHKLICSTTLPIYDIKASVNLCEAQLINSKNITTCKTITMKCADNWIKLHKPGAWLFACCQECATRTFCPTGVMPLLLRGTGIITIETGCMLKGDNVAIHSHNNYHSDMTINEDIMYIQESAINHITVGKSYSFIPDHREALDKIKVSIEAVKAQQNTFDEITSSHQTHHYTFIAFIAICTITAATWIVIYIRRRLRHTAGQTMAEEQGSKENISVTSFRHLTQPRVSDSVNEVIIHAPKRIDKATTP